MYERMGKLTALVTMVVRTVAGRGVSDDTHPIESGMAGALTWLVGIVSVELGRNASCYGHLDEKYDRM